MTAPPSGPSPSAANEKSTTARKWHLHLEAERVGRSTITDSTAIPYGHGALYSTIEEKVGLAAMAYAKLNVVGFG